MATIGDGVIATRSKAKNSPSLTTPLLPMQKPKKKKTKKPKKKTKQQSGGSDVEDDLADDSSFADPDGDAQGNEVRGRAGLTDSDVDDELEACCHGRQCHR